MASDPAIAAFGSSFTAITLAELGDKTFFVAFLLAARHRARWVFIGAFAALAAVTLISLGLGLGLRSLLPPELVPWLAAVFFGGFGIKLLVDAQTMGSQAAEEEAQAAEDLVNAAETNQDQSRAGGWLVVREAFLLVFMAELGDRTQFATIVLATAPGFSFSALLAGTLAGHALVTGLAVGAGKWIGQLLSERLLFRLSGGLFLVFAVVALRQALG
ncbi:TMEM165/GDT1 family protein [Synechococcus sp. CS-1329]|jgi:Ca2+/H+ antiporter, TMEM165/GDT1 family|uniref:TMEM165/GDT1 family protein n=1 Tax=Synechococcus sp. CS-1329 TaxID=2847975 RepID=UPI00223ABE06|nr:TMEM165/GDT1 family protein [Synechococcus sp. CS-1329]MCT0217813.1 TMEM165/GDT1 family protein [Synechococcus sp. CS-1329]